MCQFMSYIVLEILHQPPLCRLGKRGPGKSHVSKANRQSRCHQDIRCHQPGCSVRPRSEHYSISGLHGDKDSVCKCRPVHTLLLVLARAQQHPLPLFRSRPLCSKRLDFSACSVQQWLENSGEIVGREPSSRESPLQPTSPASTGLSVLGCSL